MQVASQNPTSAPDAMTSSCSRIGCRGSLRPARWADNVFGLARSLWGKARAEWTMWLADDLVAELPDADRAGKRQWAAAILWAAALDAGMDRDERLWAHIVEDIAIATDVPEDCARQRFAQLRDMGLARPRHEPPWWRDEEHR